MRLLDKRPMTRFAGWLVLFGLLALVPLQAQINRAELQRQPVNITVENGQVVDILKLLAAQAQFNLSVSGDVEGMVTVALVDVSLATALDIISAAAGASWYVSGNVIVVKPSERSDPQELETRIFRLKYLSSEAAQKMITPMLPANGKAEILSGAGASGEAGWDEIVAVTSFVQNVQRIADIINLLDRPRPLVEIEVKIIETDVRDDSKLGIQYPENISVKLGDLDDDSDTKGFASYPLGGGSWTWGRLTASEVTLLLDFLVEKGNSKLVSNPRVTTLSNQKAEIEVATTIPIETLNRFTEAGIVQDIVSFQDLDVSINLTVTPRVNEDSTIALDVASNFEEITGYTGPANNQRPITSRRSVVSTVTVKAGETLGLGGLMKEVEHKTVKRVPLLGAIPFLGNLFRHEVKSKEKTDLLILITPRLVGS